MYLINIASYVSLYIMYLYMFVGYVALRIYEYDHAPSLLYILYMLMLTLMSHHDMPRTFYPSIRHHLASVISESHPTGCGFNNFSWTSVDGNL